LLLLFADHGQIRLQIQVGCPLFSELLANRIDPQQMGHIAEQDLGSFDHRATGRAEGHQQIERRAAGLAVMDGKPVSIEAAWGDASTRYLFPPRGNLLFSEVLALGTSQHCMDVSPSLETP
jgi:hypothetical protein